MTSDSGSTTHICLYVLLCGFLVTMVTSAPSAELSSSTQSTVVFLSEESAALTTPSSTSSASTEASTKTSIVTTAANPSTTLSHTSASPSATTTTLAERSKRDSGLSNAAEVVVIVVVVIGGAGILAGVVAVISWKRSVKMKRRNVNGAVQLGDVLPRRYLPSVDRDAEEMSTISGSSVRNSEISVRFS